MTTTAILGHPGAGKSWAVYDFLKFMMDFHGFERDPSEVRKRIGLVDYHDLGEIVIMGIYDGSKFQGTDRLSMAVSVDFVRFFSKIKDEKSDPWIIAEGDRINNMTFFKAAIENGKLERIKCDPGSYDKLLEQRKQRNHVFPQAFLKTIATKVEKHNFDLTMDSSALATYLKTFKSTPWTPKA